MRIQSWSHTLPALVIDMARMAQPYIYISRPSHPAVQQPHWHLTAPHVVHVLPSYTVLECKRCKHSGCLTCPSTSLQDGADHFPPGLQNVSNPGGSPESLAATIAHLLSVHQCNPLTQALLVVTNEANREEFAGPAGFFDTIGRFPREWQDCRVISNGAASPGEWQGHSADLQLALQALGDNGLSTLVLDANLFFWPSFNLQVAPLQCEH